MTDGIVVFVLFHRFKRGKIIDRHFFDIQRDGRGSGKPWGLDTGTVQNVAGFAAHFDDEVLFEGGGAHPGKVGNDIPLGKGVHGALLLLEHMVDAFPVGFGVLFFPSFYGIGANQQVIVDGVQYAAAFGVVSVPGNIHDGGDGVHIGPGLFIQDGIGAAAGMDGEEAVPRHGGDLLREDAGGIDDQRGINGAAVGGDAMYFAILYLHAQHDGIQRDLGTVLHGVFGIGDGKPIGTDTAGGRIGDGEGKTEIGLPVAQLLPGDELGIGDAIPIFTDAAIEGNEGLKPGFFEADILPHPLKGNIKFPAELIVHGISSADIVVLERAAGKIDAGVDLAVIAAGSLQCQIGFLFHQQDIQLPFGKLPGDGGPGNAPADDEDIRLSAFQLGIPQSGDADGLLPCLIAADIIDHMGGTVFFGCQRTGLYHFLPSGQSTAEDNISLRKCGCYRRAKAFFQPPVYPADVHFPAPPVLVGQAADSIPK